MRKAYKHVLAVNDSTHMLKIKCILCAFLDAGQRRQLQDEVTNEYSIQLTAHCGELFSSLLSSSFKGKDCSLPSVH